MNGNHQPEAPARDSDRSRGSARRYQALARVRSWMRVVLPPGWVLILAVLPYLGGAAVGLIVLLMTGFIGADIYWKTLSEITAPYAAALAGWYAVYRVCVFHPALRPGYFDWLRGTPWTSKQPLPLGPIHLVWQDAVLLGLVTAIVWPIEGWRTLMVIQVFLGVYLLGLAFVLHLTGEKLWGYALAFGVGGLVLTRRTPEVFYPNAAVWYVLGLEALRRSLARFPWDEAPAIRDLHVALRRSMEPRKKASPLSLGWPFERLGPSFNDLAASGARKLCWYDVLCLGALLGWAFYVAAMGFGKGSVGPTGSERMRYLEDYVFCWMWLMLLVVGRVAIYCDGYLPPLSLMGRLAHGRPIIPGYDKVFVAPLLALVVAAAAWYIPEWTGADTVVTISIAIAVDIWILFGMGPSLESWRLTGNHRITRSVFQKDLARTG